MGSLSHKCHLRSPIRRYLALEPGDATPGTGTVNSKTERWYSWLQGRGRTEKGDTGRPGRAQIRQSLMWTRETNSDVTWGRMGIYLDYSLSRWLTIRLAFSTVTLVDGLNGLQVAWAEAEWPVWGLWLSWERTACIGRVGRSEQTKTRNVYQKQNYHIWFEMSKCPLWK